MTARMAEITVVSPIGCMGYGINARSLRRAMKMSPTFIGVDSGSTDIGPYYLGSGAIYHSRKMMKQDMRLVLNAARAARIPLITGSAGETGSRPHVDWTVEILHEIAREEGLHFRLAIIYADQEKEYLKKALRDGRVRAFPGVPPLDTSVVDGCGPLVAQMGVGPFVEALDNGADVIIAGRSCDFSIFASYCLWKGFDLGLALHMGKILECGALCATPPTGRDCAVGILGRDDFTLLSPNPERRVTPRSVAGHMVYEVEHPFLQEAPEGTLDFSAVRMESVRSGAATRVSGTRFLPRKKPTLRFEGTELRGYRSYLIGATRDPFLIAQIDRFIDGCTAQVQELEADQLDFELNWRVYGRDAVLGAAEPMRDRKDLHEVGLLVEVLAASQKRAHEVAALLEYRMIGFAYEGARTRTAHIAFPFSPLVNDTGGVYRFSVLHIVELSDSRELIALFPIEYRDL